MVEARVDLWPRRAMVLGRLASVGVHAHAATVLLFGVDGSFRLRETKTGTVHTQLRHAVVPLACLHELECGETTMAVTMLSPGQRDHAQLFERRGFVDNGSVVLRPARSECIEHFEAIHGGELSHAAVHEFLEKLIGAAPAHLASDGRIDRVARRISEQPEAQLSLAALARDVELSASRLQHLFSERMGITPRALRTWQRMRQVSRLVAEGANLTGAAHAAGFSDSAHLSRAFRVTFGLPPSRILTPSCGVHLHG